MLRQSTLALALVLATGLPAQTVVLTPTSTIINPAGGTMVFNATVSYSTPPSVLAFSASLPDGWSYSANSSSNEPPIRPADLTTGTLSWSYITTPASPATFSFNVNYPASLAGLQPLASQTVTRDEAGSAPVTATGPTVKLAVPTKSSVWNGGTDSWATASAWTTNAVTPGEVPNNSGGTTYSAKISAGAATIGSPVTINDLLLLGGTIGGLNTLTIAGSGSDWQGGVFSGLSQLIITPDAFFTASTSGNHDFVNTTITNQGQFIWQDGALRSGGTAPGGAFMNSAGATFTDASSGTTKHIANTTGGTFAFSNAGTYVKSGSSTTSIDVPFTNTGNILINAGTLGFTSTFTQSGGLLSLASGTTVSFTNALNFTTGSLTGSGTISGNVINGAASGSPAVISPGNILGHLSITGNLGLLATSQLIFDLSAATTQGVTYDFLSVGGTATLGGTLSLNLLNNARTVIVPTDTFTILSASSLTGAFLNAPNGSRLMSNLGQGSFLVTYVGNSLVLSNFNAVPEPSTWALIATGLGALALGAIRRRRAK